MSEREWEGGGGQAGSGKPKERLDYNEEQIALIRWSDSMPPLLQKGVWRTRRQEVLKTEARLGRENGRKRLHWLVMPIRLLDFDLWTRGGGA